MRAGDSLRHSAERFEFLAGVFEPFVEHEDTEFVYRTLCEMAADIEEVWKAAGDYPEGVISGDVWITGAD